jgi:hypothetical protein
MYAASQLDVSRFHPEPDARDKAAQLVSLLIPVQKAYCTDRGFDSCVLGQQILGGHGYVAEWGLEQNVRDARIAQIYEGANGIQALDLMGRKTVRSKGALLEVLLGEMNDFAQQNGSVTELAPYLECMSNTQALLSRTTTSIIANCADNPDEIGAASYAYMELLGLSLYCYMWNRVLAAAFKGMAEGAGDSDHLEGLVKTGDFFMARLLPRAKSLAEEISAGADSMMAMTVDQF